MVKKQLTGRVVKNMLREEKRREEKRREEKYSLIRCVAMLFVIAAHTPVEGEISGIIASTIFMTCNGMFYMLSGKFNLACPLNSMEEYKRFYFNKLSAIGIPYVFVSIIIFSMNIFTGDNAVVGNGEIIKSFFNAFFDANATTHLWFMYPLVGMILSAPFFAKMFSVMSDKELKLIFYIAIFWNSISVYAVKNFKIGFQYSCWFLSGWMLLFFLGYYENRGLLPQKFIISGGLLSCILTILQKFYFPDNSANIFDLAPLYILWTIGMFCFLRDHVIIKNDILKKVILFIEKNSFGVYLVHFNLRKYVFDWTEGISSKILCWFSRFTLVFAISLIISVLLNFILFRPIQKRLKNFMNHKF